MNNPFEDSYRECDLIIPPRSIVNGTAPLGVFLDYINAIDVRKLRTCDAISIYRWLGRYMDALPEAVQKQYVDGLKRMESPPE